MSETIVGIDPGQEGGIAVFYPDKPIEFKAIPRDPLDKSEINFYGLYKIFEDILNNSNKTIIFIEQQHAFPAQGVVSNAKIVGEFKAILAIAVVATHITGKICAVRVINSKKWQNALYHKDWPKEAKKDRSIMAYRELISKDLPMTGQRVKKPHIGFIDAALIAKYGAMIKKQHKEE